MAAIVPTLVLLKYLINYANVFLNKNASLLLMYNKLNHTIKIKDKEPPFKPFYNLLQSELQVLHTYLKEGIRKG
jgi:hypothetical protein